MTNLEHVNESASLPESPRECSSVYVLYDGESANVAKNKRNLAGDAKTPPNGQIYTK
jgi:hypothetical protein